MKKQKQTDNDAEMFAIKVRLREELLDERKTSNILEAFAGDGRIWGEVRRRHPEKQFNILRIDMKDDKAGIYLRGDNLKFMAGLDLPGYDIIDLDAYGSPFEQLELVFKSGYCGPVVCTFIQTMAGQLNKRFLAYLGYTPKMVSKCPSLFNIGGFDKMKAYLAKKGVKKVRFCSENRKNYFSFWVEKKM